MLSGSRTFACATWPRSKACCASFCFIFVRCAKVAFALTFLLSQFLLELLARFDTSTFYPGDLASRCKIDTMLDWRQSSLYKHIATYSYPGLGFGGDALKVEGARQDLKAQLEDMVRVYLKEGKYMGGFDHPTLADLAVAPALIFCTVVPGNTFPKAVEEYLARCAEGIKSWKELIAPLEGYIKSKMDSHKVELHELPISANSLGCMMLCKDNALPVEFINAMGKTRTEEFMAFNPMHCCPTVKDGDHAVWESNVCLRYLAQK